MNTLLKFQAIWCGPCGALSRTLKTIDLGSTELIEIDVDIDSSVVKYHDVRSIPTLILIDSKTNKEIKRCTGVKTKEQLLQFLGIN